MAYIQSYFSKKEIGTHVYGSDVTILDQFLVSKAIASTHYKYPFKIESVDIIQYPEMVKGDYNTPIRFSRPSKSDYNPDGYSDYVPVKLVLRERE